jgi:NADPH2:quinone reductase
MPTTMRAIEITRPGSPEVLQLCERPLPALKPGEVLIKVHAAGVNRPDVLQRLGHYPVPPGASDLPGLEVAGELVDGNLSGSDFRQGDLVCALVQGGGYAEYCAAPLEQCLPVPRGLNAVEAASLPETFFTVWSNVFDRAHLSEGETLLVQGGSSGIGVSAIQLARALGHRVFATAGSDDKCRSCEALGAERAIK